MTPRPHGSESSKAVPVGEPPTPEGWPKTIWLCEKCGEQPGAVNLPCACVDWGKRIKVQAFRVAPVGGAGEPDDERLVETVEKALREAVIVEGPEGERAMDFSLDRLARAAVAAVRAAGGQAE